MFHDVRSTFIIIIPERMKVIPVNEFENYCNELHKFRNYGFEEEYEVMQCHSYVANCRNMCHTSTFYIQSLSSEPLYSHDISATPTNRPKNRFANIFPCEYKIIMTNTLSSSSVSLLTIVLWSDDESRVVLSEIPGVEGSDYINASWIDVGVIMYSYEDKLMLCVFFHRATNVKMHTLQVKVCSYEATYV